MSSMVHAYRRIVSQALVDCGTHKAGRCSIILSTHANSCKYRYGHILTILCSHNPEDTLQLHVTLGCSSSQGATRMKCTTSQASFGWHVASLIQKYVLRPYSFVTCPVLLVATAMDVLGLGPLTDARRCSPFGIPVCNPSSHRTKLKQSL